MLLKHSLLVGRGIFELNSLRYLEELDPSTTHVRLISLSLSLSSRHDISVHA